MMLRRHNGTFELSLSLFAGIIIVFAAAVWGLIPQMKTFLQLQEVTESQIRKSVKLQAEYDRLYTQKEALEADAAALAEQLENQADAASVQAWINTVWNGAEVTGGKEEGAFVVAVPAASPAAYYRFVDRMDSAPWIVSVGLPISMRAQGDKIRIVFTLRAATPTVGTSLPQKETVR